MPISKIKTSGIEDSAITSAKIGVDVIVAEDIANNAITVAELSDGAVTSAKLDTNIDVAGTLDVTGATTLDDGLTVDNDGATVATFDRATSDGDIVEFQQDGTIVGTIGVDGGDNLYITGESGNTGGIYMNDAAVSPAYQGVERDNYYDLGKAPARWKNLYLSGGVYVGGTVAANYLDDYEEGEWEPTWSSTGGTINTNATYSEGKYTKIGRIVFVQGRLYTNSVSSPTGTVTVSGLPFTVKNIGDNENPFVFYVTQLTGTLSGTPMGFCVQSTTTMTVVDQVFGSGGRVGDWADHFNNDVFAWFSTSYIVD